MVLEQIVAASIIVSLISFVGVLTLAMRDDLLHSLLFVFVSLAAGTLLAAAFFHLIPESIEMTGVGHTMQLAVAGIVMFLIIEKFLHWHHHHKHHHVGDKDEQPFTYLNLIGDGIHNFIDGSVIAVSFLTDTGLGIVSTLAIIAHEIPQEIGDFSLLIYGGFTKKKAIIFNFLTALTALVGAVVTFYLYAYIPGLIAFLIPLAAGHFIYIACVDLVPELHKERNVKKSAMQMAGFLAGILLIVALGTILEGAG